MNDETLNGLLRAIVTSPEDDTVRLAYADRLDELSEGLDRIRCNGIWCGHKCKPGRRVVNSGRRYRYGEARDDECTKCHGVGTVPDDTLRERAEYIRNRIAIESVSCICTPPRSPWRKDSRGSQCAYCRLRERGNRLWLHRAYGAVPEGWSPRTRLAADPTRRGLPGSNELEGAVVFRRGFIETIECTAKVFLDCADSIVWNHTQAVACGASNGTCTIAPWCTECRDEIGLPTGRVKRPFLTNAHPVTRVVLTAPLPHDSSFGSVTVNYLKRLFPFIEFVPPPRYEEGHEPHNVGDANEE